jgi:hypothetical protein
MCRSRRIAGIAMAFGAMLVTHNTKEFARVSDPCGLVFSNCSQSVALGQIDSVRVTISDWLLWSLVFVES